MQDPEQSPTRFLREVSHWFVVLAVVWCFLSTCSVRADSLSSVSLTEVYRDAIRNDPDFGASAIPIVSSTLTASYFTNIIVSGFSKKTPWDISIGYFEVSGTFSNDANYVVGKTSVTFPFIDPNSGLVSGSISMSWQTSHLLVKVTASSDLVDALDYYTGETQTISDSADMTISVGRFTNTATLYLRGRNTYRFDAATQLDLDSGNLIGKGDFIAPTVSLQTPGPNYSSFNSAFTIAGTTADNIAVGAVLWRWAAPGDDPTRGAAHFNDWSSVDTLNLPDFGYVTHASWNSAVDMSFNGPGTNRLWVASQDAAGHFSTIQTRVFFYSVPSYFTLQATDGGRAIGSGGAVNNAQLIIDRRYSVNAIANDTNNIFLNWTDGDGNVVSIVPRYSFLMQDSLLLQANFGPNPFPDVKGTYVGLFNPTNGVSELDSGLISLTVDGRGFYSGTLALESGIYRFSGQFGFYGNPDAPDAADSTFEITAKGLKPIDGSLHLAGAGEGVLSRNLTGQLSIYDSRLARRVVSVIDAGYSGGNTGGVAAGLYNYQLPSANDTTQVGPLGYGYGSITLRSNATATVMVDLADKAPVVSCKTALLEDGTLPLFASAYSGTGIVIGWLTFTNEAMSDLRGDDVHWIKRRQKTAYYADGFNRSFQVTGCRYVAPKTGTNILGWASGTATFADFAFSGSGEITFDPKINRFSFPSNPDNFRIGFSPTTGVFSGTLSSPALPVRGVLLPKSNTALGFFLNQNQSGFVIFSTP